MAKAYIHNGPLETIQPDSSPGLLFLKAFLPAVDSLFPDTTALEAFLAPKAVFIINGGDPITAETIFGMFKARSQRLKSFGRDLKSAWDVEMESGKRMVLYETVSVTIFNDDEEKAIKIPEFSTIELEPSEGGVEGLVASVLKAFMDTNPIIHRR